jgi:predicted kinase
MILVLMGVTGTGKTTVGLLLAEALDAEFAEGDSYHPPANVEKMRRGIPLDDADRRPWLEALSAEIGRWLAEGRTVVLACSALRQAYRDLLAAGRACTSCTSRARRRSCALASSGVAATTCRRACLRASSPRWRSPRTRSSSM